jgi:hypothetical protein
MAECKIQVASHICRINFLILLQVAVRVRPTNERGKFALACMNASAYIAEKSFGSIVVMNNTQTIITNPRDGTEKVRWNHSSALTGVRCSTLTIVFGVLAIVIPILCPKSRCLGNSARVC